MRLFLLLSLLLLTTANRRALAADGAMHITLEGEKELTLYVWLESSLSRVFPQTKPGTSKLELLAPCNGAISVQACVRNERDYILTLDGAIEGANDLGGPTRFVGRVPVAHHTNGIAIEELDGVGHIPGLVPGPLYPETKTPIGQHESRSYWITLRIPADARPGKRELKLRFFLGDHRQEAELPVLLEFSEFVVKPREKLLQVAQ